jgi:hypothetical protein
MIPSAAEVLIVQSPTVRRILPFVLHGPQWHAEPFVQLSKLLADVGPGRGEIVRHETLAPPRSPAVSSENYRPVLSRRRKVGPRADPAGGRERRGTFIGQCRNHCEQARPPDTPWAEATDRVASLRRRRTPGCDRAGSWAGSSSLGYVSARCKSDATPVGSLGEPRSAGGSADEEGFSG